MDTRTNEAGYYWLEPDAPWNFSEDCQVWCSEHGITPEITRRIGVNPELGIVRVLEWATKDGTDSTFYVDPLTNEPAIREPYTVPLKRDPNLKSPLKQPLPEWVKMGGRAGD